MRPRAHRTCRDLEIDVHFIKNLCYTPKPGVLYTKIPTYKIYYEFGRKERKIFLKCGFFADFEGLFRAV